MERHILLRHRDIENIHHIDVYRQHGGYEALRQAVTTMTPDEVIDVATGWKESFHQVDGLGVAYSPQDGSVDYGRGTYNFADPLLRDADGK